MTAPSRKAEPAEQHPRRAMTMTVLATIAAAGSGWYATTRIWQTVETARPDPLPPLVAEHTGTAVAEWALPCSLVALATAVAMVAAKGPIRAAVSIILTAAGAGMATGGGYGMAEAAGPWPILTAVCGVVTTVLGVHCLRHSRDWPAMSARYDPKSATAQRPALPDEADGVDPVQAWNALDRGEDPTSPTIGQTATGEGSVR